MTEHHQRKEIISAWPATAAQHLGGARSKPGSGGGILTGAGDIPPCAPSSPSTFARRTMGMLSRCSDEFELLSSLQKLVVETAIDQCRITRRREVVRCRTGGEVTVWPHPDGFAWCFDNPYNFARGVRP